jgi:hypothetical protein
MLGIVAAYGNYFHNAEVKLRFVGLKDYRIKDFFIANGYYQSNSIAGF